MRAIGQALDMVVHVGTSMAGLGSRLDGEPTPSLIGVRLATPLPIPPIGADLAAYGYGDDQNLYYCKDDVGHRRVRATEFLFTALADIVKIPTAPFEIVSYNDRLLFGSQASPSSLSKFHVQRFCSEPARDEIGSPSLWKASFFSSLIAFDIFIGNVDRQACNLIAYGNRGLTQIAAIDFASTSLLIRPTVDLDLKNSATFSFRATMDAIHGDDAEAANAMLRRLESVPSASIQAILDRMPSDWLDEADARRFMEFWGGHNRVERLALIRAGLTNGKIY